MVGGGCAVTACLHSQCAGLTVCCCPCRYHFHDFKQLEFDHIVKGLILHLLKIVLAGMGPKGRSELQHVRPCCSMTAPRGLTVHFPVLFCGAPAKHAATLRHQPPEGVPAGSGLVSNHRRRQDQGHRAVVPVQLLGRFDWVVCPAGARAAVVRPGLAPPVAQAHVAITARDALPSLPLSLCCRRTQVSPLDVSCPHFHLGHSD